jgi:hypothetical protein
MKVLRINNDLTITVDDDDVVHLTSNALRQDGDRDCVGTVVIYANEIDALIVALTEAAAALRRRDQFSRAEADYRICEDCERLRAVIKSVLDIYVNWFDTVMRIWDMYKITIK